MRQGFTLIELSIVLVIIGLIVGGILTGRDLIAAAAVRAQISQIEKFQTATNTFRGKYGYLPGDIRDPDASKFGFAVRGAYTAEGDGDGVIEGNPLNTPGAHNGTLPGNGEEAMFWQDLSIAGLVEGNFSAAFPGPPAGGYFFLQPGGFFPNAKLGTGNLFVYVWSGGCGLGTQVRTGINHFGVSYVANVGSGPVGPWGSISDNGAGPGIPVSQAYSVDSKMDDGLPQSGNVTAQALMNQCGGNAWAAGNNNNTNFGAASASGGPTTAATPASSNTCYDNGNSAGTVQHYSLSNSTTNPNCGLSFKFQ